MTMEAAMLIVLLAVPSFAVGLATAWYFYLMLWHPARTREAENETKLQKFRRHLLTISAMYGLGFMIFRGVEGMLWWLPRNWTHPDEDGDQVWVAHTIALFVAAICTIIVISKLMALAEARSRGEATTEPPQVL